MQIWLLSVWICEVLNKCDEILPWQIAKHFELTKFNLFWKKKLRFWDLEISAVIRQFKYCTFSFWDNGLTKSKSKPPKATTQCFSMFWRSFLFCPLFSEGLLIIGAIGKKWGRGGCFVLFGIFSYLISGQNSLRFYSSVILLFKTRHSGSQNQWEILKQNIVCHLLVSIFRRFPQF